MHVLVVESPSKAKTIQGYLGKDYHVCASYGHIRDLAPQEHSVDPENDFSMKWFMDVESKKRIQDIVRCCSSVESLILATDPDREGEAIAWHVLTCIQQIKEIQSLKILRVVFHEITKTAVIDAIKKPRSLDYCLVDAYLARRALDYLVGYNLSPILWRKLPGARSAGRVQSVVLRAICEREQEIECFSSQEYWSIEGLFQASDNQVFSANLTHLNGEKLHKFFFSNQESCQKIASELNQNYILNSLEKKMIKKKPNAPFSTSTLQQEANKKLGFSSSRTMQIAQKLYEGIDIGSNVTGLITYMRTDSVHMNTDVIQDARNYIQKNFGKEYIPESFRKYTTKTKNAQEAHECIRPTNFLYTPEKMKKYLSNEHLGLYDLIWRRALASQMTDALFERVNIGLLETNNKNVEFHTTGSILKFQGYLYLYPESCSEERSLPLLNKGDNLILKKSNLLQHFTKPPARFTEATLVQVMEELGIGRPSTYAPILRVLQERDYAVLEKGRFFPKDKGRLVVAFLSCFFERYVDYHFTADLEGKLDQIANGELQWKQVLKDFWLDFYSLCQSASELTGVSVREELDKTIGEHFFKIMQKKAANMSITRKCPSCADGKLFFNFGKWGYFISCSNYPSCHYTCKPGFQEDEIVDYPKNLGRGIVLNKGPYGLYVQKENEKKVKRVSVPKNINAEDISYEVADYLLSLPKMLGEHPETGKPIYVGIGRFGPFVRMDKTFVSLSSNIMTVDLDIALHLLKEETIKKKDRILGYHPNTGEAITLEKGRFGPYLKMGKINISIKSEENISLSEAIDKLDQRIQKNSKKSSKKVSTASKSFKKKNKNIKNTKKL